MHCSSHHPTTLLVALPTHKTPRNTIMVAHPHRGGTGQAFVQKTSPWRRSQPLGGSTLLLEDEGGA